MYDDLKGRIYDMSVHKFASNVIEKALSYGTIEQRSEIIKEIISKDDLVHDSLLSMVKDKFGNYVVQKALLVTKGELYMKMLTIISKGINELKQTAFGNKLIVKLINTHKELGNLLANSPHGNTNLGGTNSNNNYNVNTYGGFNGHNKRNNNWKK